MVAKHNFELVQNLFKKESDRFGLKGVFGVTSFKQVYNAILPEQKMKLKELSDKDFKNFFEKGSIISIGYAFPRFAIDSIALKKGKVYDKKTWNIYSREYRRLNNCLNDTADEIAGEIEGISLPATLTKTADKIKHVEEYYPQTISHRVAAEQSGLGWRGKNELIVNPHYSCAIRLASIITSITLKRTNPTTLNCGNCHACLDACSFLRHKHKLNNYREQCRRYIVHLNLESDVCGKCVKACLNKGIHKNSFIL